MWVGVGVIAELFDFKKHSPFYLIAMFENFQKNIDFLKPLK